MRRQTLTKLLGIDYLEKQFASLQNFVGLRFTAEPRRTLSENKK